MNVRPSGTPKSDHHAKAVRIADAQGWLCSICGRPILRNARFGGNRGLTVDHVWPRALGRPRMAHHEAQRHHEIPPANTTAAHGECNRAKGHRPPRGCELVWLSAVNARLGRR